MGCVYRGSEDEFAYLHIYMYMCSISYRTGECTICIHEVCAGGV